MKVVDSSGWMEYFADGENADFFKSAIEDPARLIVPTVVIYEVFKKLYQEKGEEHAFMALGWMSEARTVELDTSLAIEAAQQSAELQLPMADAIILVTARRFRASLLTQDKHFKNVAGVLFPGGAG